MLKMLKNASTQSKIRVKGSWLRLSDTEKNANTTDMIKKMSKNVR